MVNDESESRARSVDTWLAVDTGTAAGSVAVWRGGLAFEQTIRILSAHSERVLPAIDRALEMTEAEPRDVSSFIIGAGPGSFTGVRIAASLAKGWCTARSSTLYAYSSLLSVAAGTGVGGPICPLFDARRGEVYGACYDLSSGRVAEVMEPGAWKIDELLAALKERKVVPTFAGEGAIIYHDAIGRCFAGARVLPEHLAAPRAASLLWLRRTFPELGRIEEPRSWEPQYVRDWRVKKDEERNEHG